MEGKIDINKEKRSFIGEFLQNTELNVKKFFKDYWVVILFFAIAIICAYGFELFNFNITIDEENSGYRNGPTLWYIMSDRWGMYLIQRIFLPNSILPFVPLFLSLIFRATGIFLILLTWDSFSKRKMILIGSTMLIFPTLAYIDSFSVNNYGIGFGYLLVGVGIIIFTRTSSLWRFIAFVPLSIALGIYQGFIPVIVAVFGIFFVLQSVKKKHLRWKLLFEILVALIISYILYFVINKIFLLVYKVPSSGYIESYFDLNYLTNNFSIVISLLVKQMNTIYMGNSAVFGTRTFATPVIIVLALIGGWYKIITHKSSIATKILLSFSLPVILVIPFVSGLFTRGHVLLRSLLALPISIGGILALAMVENKKLIQLILSFALLVGSYQFVVSNNSLFASSHLALQADRLLASRIVTKIDEATANQENPIYFVEIVGYTAPEFSDVIHKSEVIGSSFFEWDEGNSERIVGFFETVGSSGYYPLPPEKRGWLVLKAEDMPIWPANGSVQIFNDTVVVKFGSYSDSQKGKICSIEANRDLLKATDFCH
jgi:hypothetical protein